MNLPLTAGQCALSWSCCNVPGDSGDCLTLFGVARDRLQHLAAVLAAAGLKVVAAVPAVVAGVSRPEMKAVLTLGLDRAVLQVGGAGGVLLLREFALTTGRSTSETVTELRRGVRVALASLPPQVLDALDRIRLGDARGHAGEFADSWNRQSTPESTLGGAAMLMEPDTDTEDAASAALTCLQTGAVRPFVFPPRTESERGPVMRRLARATVTAVVVAAVAAGFWAYQSWTLAGLHRRMDSVRPAAYAAEAARDRVRELAPWFDREPVSLNILKTVTEAFPEQGTVVLTRFTVGADGTVGLSGRSTSLSAWTTMQETLRRAPGVSELRVEQTRTGSTTRTAGVMTFHITFGWTGGSSR